MAESKNKFKLIVTEPESANETVSDGGSAFGDLLTNKDTEVVINKKQIFAIQTEK